MTRIVVRDPELHEALTVVDIPASFMRAVEAGGWRSIRIPVEWSIEAEHRLNDRPTEPLPRHYVELRLEAVYRHGHRRPLFWYAEADDPVLALRLRTAFLPGQLSEVHRREQEAYWRGAFAGLLL